MYTRNNFILFLQHAAKDMSKEAAQEIIAADTAMNNLTLQVGFLKHY